MLFDYLGDPGYLGITKSMLGDRQSLWTTILSWLAQVTGVSLNIPK